MRSPLTKGVFLLSIDTELAWGNVFRSGAPEDWPDWHLYSREREAVDGILTLLERYDIRATWAVVGHLFLDHCEAEHGRKHPDIKRPSYRWFSGDWFDADPAKDLQSEPFWYGSDIVDRICRCPVPQEVASHSFSHMFFDDPDCGTETIETELAASQRVATERGITLKSFVFPQNRVGHLDVLREKGFIAYRGLTRRWFDALPRPLWRVAHKLDSFLPISPPVVRPKQTGGLWNFPGSYYFRHRRGWGRWLPIWLRTLKGKLGLRRSVQHKGLFHLWFHPYDIADDMPGLLRGLEGIFQEVSRLRAMGVVENLTLGELAERLDASRREGAAGARSH